MAAGPRRDARARIAPTRCSRHGAGGSRASHSSRRTSTVSTSAPGLRTSSRFHGSLWELACASRCAGSPPVWRHDEPFAELPPRCPAAGDWRGPESSGSARRFPPRRSRGRAPLWTATCASRWALRRSCIRRRRWWQRPRSEARGPRRSIPRPRRPRRPSISPLACPAEQALDDVERLLSEGDPPRGSGLS